MDADSTEDASLPSLQIHLSSPLPGSSVPIRAPLTIDSDSDFCLSNNDHIYSRTSSFNSCSSIDISSYGDEHTSVLEEEEDNTFAVYPYEEIVIENTNGKKYLYSRPSLKYPDGNYVNESSNFKESTIFRPSVKTLYEESTSADIATKLGVPIAPVTSDRDSDTDIDSVDGRRWFDSGRIRNVQKVSMAPKVRIFDGDEGDDEVDDKMQVECMFSGDGIAGIEELNPVSGKLVEDDGCKAECLNEAVKLLGSDESSFGLERLHTQISSSSNNEIETETINVKISEADELSFDMERIDAQIVSSLNSEIDIDTMNVKLSESDELSLDLERIDAQAVSSLNNEIDIDTMNVKLSESDDLSLHLEKIDAQAVSCLNSDIDTINVKLSESDELSSDLERVDAQIVSNSDNHIEIKTVNASEQEAVFYSSRNESKEPVSEKEDKLLVKMQPIMTKFKGLALRKQLTTEVNREGGNDKCDFHLTILAIGRTGVGKSATINTIIGENKALTNAFDPGTTTIQEINGNVDGIQLSFIDTPGLKCSSFDRSYNLRILNAIKRFTQKRTPDVVLYVDRLDTHTQDYDDSQHLRLITSSLGSSVWGKCIIALTHATSNPLDESLGEFVNQRCRFIQEQIVRNGGNNQYMANAVWLVENHPCCRYGSIHLDEDVCDQVPSFEPLRESRDNVNHNMEQKGLFQRLQLSLKLSGSRNWCLACRLDF